MESQFSKQTVTLAREKMLTHDGFLYYLPLKIVCMYKKGLRMKLLHKTNTSSWTFFLFWTIFLQNANIA